MGMFAKELARSIRGSWGRFLAIAAISALGCGFYAGLNMCGSNMRSTADSYYDGTDLYDIRLVSTMGFSDDQLERVSSVEGVKQAVGAYSTDVMARIDGENYATRICSFDAEAAADSTTSSDGMVVDSDDDSYLNRLTLTEGRWPTSSDECVLSDCHTSDGIGVGDTVTVLYGTSDLDGVLEVRTFKVVGMVHSPAVVDDSALGYTNLGSGEIQEYIFVTRDAFADDLPYTEIYLTVDGAEEEQFGTDAYQDKVDEVADRIDAISGELAAARLEEVKGEAQAELDDAKADYENQKATAEAQLAEAKAALDEALRQLEESEAEIESGELAIADGYAQVEQQAEEAERQLADARSALQSQEDSLASALQEIDDGLAEVSEGEQQVADARAQLDELAAVPDSYAQVTEAISQLTMLQEQLAATTDETERAQIQAQIDALPSMEELEASKAELEAAVAAVGLSDVSEVDAYVAEQRAQLDQTSETLAATRDDLETKREQVVQGQEQVAEGWRSYDEQAASARQAISDARATLEAKAAELADGKRQLEEGRASYESGLAEYEESSAKAADELADAAAQLEAAQADIDELEEPDVYVLDRTQNVGIECYKDDAGRMDNIASVFPLIFFLVAALVSLTTMTRMVEDDRVDIGTHKALGFSTAYISMHYVCYALLASGIGAVVGIAVLAQVLPYIVHAAYGVMYTVPQESLPLTVDLGIAVRSALAGIGITLAATWLAAWSSLREMPSTLMLPKAPKPGKRILLEHIGPLWRRMSFSWKVTMRNLFRYKKRLAMTVVGIAGCTALLVTGLGVRDAIWDIIHIQFEGDDPIFSYNVLVGLDDGCTDAQISEVEDTLEEVGDATSFAEVDFENMQISSSGRDDTIAIRLMVTDDPEELLGFVDMRDRVSGEDVAFDEDSVVLTEKVANELGVGVGDTFTLYEQDAIGNATGDGIELTCTGITENYPMHYCYVGAQAWEDATGETAQPNAVLTDAEDSDEARERISSAFDGNEAVQTIMFTNETIDSYRTSLKAVDMVMVILVVAAAALAFIVLYNLTNINIIERIREIASLKVLGFTRREVAAYVFREIIVLVIIGAALGLVLGKWLGQFVVLSAEIDVVMFGRTIHASSYLIAFVTTLAFSGVVMLAMMPKLRHIDMVESLKSVD